MTSLRCHLIVIIITNKHSFSTQPENINLRHPIITSIYATIHYLGLHTDWNKYVFKYLCEHSPICWFRNISFAINVCVYLVNLIEQDSYWINFLLGIFIIFIYYTPKGVKRYAKRYFRNAASSTLCLTRNRGVLM